jgi:hypothetical protein
MPVAMRLSSSVFLLLSLAACGGSISPSGTRDAATSGSGSGTADAARSCTPAFLEAGTGNVENVEVPVYHRASPSCCPATRAPGPQPQPFGAGAAMTCTADSQCTDGTDGRCFPFEGLLGGGGCSYDTCFTDTDCPSNAPCICRGSASDETANSCATKGNCSLDSDCGRGGFCSPSMGACDYSSPDQSALAAASFYCHTPADTCINDTDCAPPAGDAGEGCPMSQACAYDTGTNHWGCVSERCCPP